MTHFADRLADAARRTGNPLCVGLDPRWESLPREIRDRHRGESLEQVAAAFEEFGARIIDLVAGRVPILKPQAAFFEACGPDGFAAMGRLLDRARSRGLLTLLDSKRGDIASTASAYADAAFAGTPIAGRVHPVWRADALTVNPYLGRDAVEPFIAAARRVGAGVFVLVRTSNPGAGLFQDLVVKSDDRPLYQHVGAAVAGWASENVGACGFGDVGAVVGATYPAEMGVLRGQLPEVVFLVPGFGAQGGTADDTRPAFRADGLGAVVNSSRGITFPFAPDAADWEARIEAALDATIASLRGITSPEPRTM